MNFNNRFFLSLSLVLALACSDDSGTKTSKDAATGSEAGTDAGIDAATDGTTGGDAQAPTSTEPRRVTCSNAAITPPTTGTCTATKGTGTGVLLRGTVLAPDTVYENGHLLVASGKIVCVGCDCSKETAYKDATVVACAKGVISPGLINTHDHLGWATLPPSPTTTRYDHRHEWRKGKNGKPKISVGGSNYKWEAVAIGELRMVIGGATSMMGANTGATGLVRNLDGKTEGLSASAVQDNTFPLGDSGGSMCKGSTSCYTLPSATTIKGYKAWVPHVAEGGREEAHNEFMAISGQLSGTTNLLGANTALIHSVGLNARDVQMMAAASARVIWSPRSNISLYGYTAPVVMMDNLGVNIALGTDWTPSGSMNMLRELACAGYLNEKHFGGHFKAYQLWAMATGNAADSMGSGAELGRLKTGYWADIAIFDGSKLTTTDWPHKAVVTATVREVVLVMRAGKTMHGDTDLIKVLDSNGGTGCTALTDCLSTKSVCAKNETGKTLAEIKTVAGTSTYALFFCKTPDKEPTCVPQRPSEYDCSGVASADADCDGVQDSSDTCSAFFNPIMLMHNGKQPDTESDKVGDECDVCPFDTTNTTPCKTKKPDPDDTDGDGHKNAVDNCPYVANKDQKDTDGDLKGDACDPCPNYKNPGTAACLFTLKEIRDPSAKTRPADGTKVKLEKLIVTSLPTSSATTTKGFYVRDGVGAYQAIYVYTGLTNPPKDTAGTALKLGDEVTVEGDFKDYNKIDEIYKPTTIKVTTAGTAAPAAIALKTKDLTAGTEAEKWESHLVTVSTVKVAVAATTTDDNFWITDEASNTCTGTAPTCTEVGDFYFDGGTVDGKPDNSGTAWKVGDKCTSITGIVNGFIDKHALEPGDTTGFVCN